MRFKTTILLICLFFMHSNSLFGRDYWGLRNINTRIGDEAYESFNADYYAYPVSWARTELQDDEFNWNALDNSLDFAENFGGKVVLVVSCNSSWACDGQMQAPNDLDRRQPLSENPPDNGYSESLYDFTYQLVDHIAQRDNPIVKYLRFVNEPEYNWVVGRNWEQDIEDYVRCLRTFYIAAHAAAEDNEIEISVSHGGFNLVRSLARKYYRIGEDDEDLQDSLMTLLQSRYERHSTRIRSWEDVARLVEGRGGMPPNFWADVMAGQTEWLDWFDIHYHFKPRFIFDELGSFEQTVQDSGGEVKPWLAAEAAMQLAQGGLTEYDERFHAADMARKWILGMAFGLEGICTPMTGYPPEHFFGLYDDQQEEYLSATAYRFLRSIIQPLHEPEDLSVGDFKHYLFDEGSSLIDLIWWETLFDTSRTGVMGYNIQGLEEPCVVKGYTILGEIVFEGVLDPNGDTEFEFTGQEPFIIQRNLRENIDEDESKGIVDDFQLLSVYPNPFNSQTNISFTLNRSCPATVTIYDLYGHQVGVLFNGIASAGSNQLTWMAGEHPSGLYFIQLKASNQIFTQKVMLIR